LVIRWYNKYSWLIQCLWYSVFVLNVRIGLCSWNGDEGKIVAYRGIVLIDLVIIDGVERISDVNFFIYDGCIWNAYTINWKNWIHKFCNKSIILLVRVYIYSY